MSWTQIITKLFVLVVIKYSIKHWNYLVVLNSNNLSFDIHYRWRLWAVGELENQTHYLPIQLAKCWLSNLMCPINTEIIMCGTFYKFDISYNGWILEKYLSFNITVCKVTQVSPAVTSFKDLAVFTWLRSSIPKRKQKIGHFKGTHCSFWSMPNTKQSWNT